MHVSKSPTILVHDLLQVVQKEGTAYIANIATKHDVDSDERRTASKKTVVPNIGSAMSANARRPGNQQLTPWQSANRRSGNHTGNLSISARSSNNRGPAEPLNVDSKTSQQSRQIRPKLAATSASGYFRPEWLKG